MTLTESRAESVMSEHIGTLERYDRYFTVREVAQITRQKEGTVRAWIRRGLLKGVRFTNRIVLIPQDELDRWLTPKPGDNTNPF